MSGPNPCLDAERLADLADRVEALRQQGRTINAEIGAAMGEQYQRAFTTSVDAAMTLIPAGWLTERAHQDYDGAQWHWRLYPAFYATKAVWAEAGSAALALTAAALRAHVSIAKSAA